MTTSALFLAPWLSAFLSLYVSPSPLVITGTSTCRLLLCTYHTHVDTNQLHHEPTLTDSDRRLSQQKQLLPHLLHSLTHRLHPSFQQHLLAGHPLQPLRHYLTKLYALQLINRLHTANQPTA